MVERRSAGGETGASSPALPLSMVDDATLALVKDPKSGMEVELIFNDDGRAYELGDAFGHLAFYVESVDAMFDEGKGVAFSLEPKSVENGTRIAFAVDPTGYKIELVERPEAA